MKALVRAKKGKNFANVELKDLPSPRPSAKEVIVKNYSSRINPVDLQMMNGMPMVKYKDPQLGGVDGAGIVSEVGSDVDRFKVGDRVMFYRSFVNFGTWAEQIAIESSDCAIVPDHLGLKEAGTLPLVLMTAYEGINALEAQQGDQVLIHGAAGGVGNCAVQIAHHRGLEVIATASKKDHSFLQSQGVKTLIDYRTDDFSKVLSKGSVDYIFDTVGGESLLKSIALMPKTVTSAKLMDPAILEELDLHVNFLVKWIMGFGMRKYVHKAKEVGVCLKAVAAKPQGHRLQQIIDEVGSYISSPVKVFTPIRDLASKPLNERSIGSAITF